MCRSTRWLVLGPSSSLPAGVLSLHPSQSLRFPVSVVTCSSLLKAEWVGMGGGSLLEEMLRYPGFYLRVSHAGGESTVQDHHRLTFPCCHVSVLGCYVSCPWSQLLAGRRADRRGTGLEISLCKDRGELLFLMWPERWTNLYCIYLPWKEICPPPQLTHSASPSLLKRKLPSLGEAAGWGPRASLCLRYCR